MRTSEQVWLKASEAARRVGFSARTLIRRAAPKDGQPGEFGDGARFFPYRVVTAERRMPARAGKGGVLPPPRLGEWRIEARALEEWADRGRVFLQEDKAA